jgi:hypothetical protein
MDTDTAKFGSPNRGQECSVSEFGPIHRQAIAARKAKIQLTL